MTTPTPVVDVVGVKELYNKLKKRSSTFSAIGLMVRTCEGIRALHSLNIMTLFWYHLFLTDRTLYDRLKTTDDESSLRQMLSGRVQTTYVLGDKTITVCSDMFPHEFLEIINAYLDYAEEISH